MKSGSIPAEIRAMVGKEARPQIYEVTRKDIRRFTQAIGDPNPVYVDEDYAKKTIWGGIIAPPLFFLAFAFEDVPETQLREDGSPIETELNVPLPATRTIGGASSIEVGWPLRPGDTITVRKRVADLYCKEGRSGLLYFTVIETTYTNQAGQFVGCEKATYIQR